MKRETNVVKQYFDQKGFSAVEWVCVVLIAVSAIVATFVTGGGPIGLPLLLVGVIGFVICRGRMIKDDEIDKILARLIEENKIESTANTLRGYNLTHEIIKRRKDGKCISPEYYMTDLVFDIPGETVFHVHVIDMLSQSVKKNTYRVKEGSEISLIEKDISSMSGRKAAYIKIGYCDALIPVSLSDYASAKLIEKIIGLQVKQ